MNQWTLMRDTYYNSDNLQTWAHHFNGQKSKQITAIPFTNNYTSCNYGIMSIPRVIQWMDRTGHR